MFLLICSPSIRRHFCRNPLFTTPPSTRKRKGAEAAIADDDQPSLKAKAATKAAHARNATASDPRPPKPGSTVPATSQSTETERGSSASSAGQKKRDLATPATTTASMDSDDDFLSDVSSPDDFLDTQNSDDESLGEGTCG